MVQELEGLPRSSITILRTLEERGPLRSKDITKITMLSPRTTRTALRRLMERSLVKKHPDLQDTRSYLYSAIKQTN